jgi:hypothetical protein
MTKLNKRIAVYAAIGIAILLIAGVTIAMRQSGSAESPALLLSLGEQYLSELDYEQALVQFLKVIEIEPMNERAYLGAAEAYVGLGQTDRALEILRQGLERTGSDEIQVMIDMLENTENAEEPNGASFSPDMPIADESGRSLLSEDEWVIAGISVIHGSIFDFAEMFGAEVMGPLNIVEGITGWNFHAEPPNADYENGFTPLVYATQYEASNQLVQIRVEQSGITGPRGIVIGETTYEEVIGTLPEYNGPVEYNGEGQASPGFAGSSGESWASAAFDKNNTVYPNPPDVPYRIEFMRLINGQRHMYHIDFSNGIVHSLYFEIYHEDR